MELIGSRPCDNGDLPTRRTTEFRCERGSLNAKLLHGVHGNQAVGSPLHTEPGQGAAGRLRETIARSDSNVRTGAIDCEVVGIRTLSVHTKLPLACIRGWRYSDAGCQHNQRLKTSAIQRHVFHEPAVHHGAHACILRVDQRGAAFDCDGLGDRANRKGEIDGEGSCDVHHHVRLNQCFESNLRHLNAIRSWGEVRDGVDAFAVRRAWILNSCGIVRDQNVSPGDGATGWVKNQAANRSVRRLGDSESPEEGTEQQDPEGKA